MDIVINNITKSSDVWSAMAALGAASAAITSLLVVYLTKKIAHDNLFHQCLERYIECMKLEAQAIQENKMTFAYCAQYNLIDLRWFEYRLWKEGSISDKEFSLWMCNASESYKSDKPDLRFSNSVCPFNNNGYASNNTEKGMVIVSYKRVWDYINNKDSKHEDQDYVDFITNIHEYDKKQISEFLKNEKRKDSFVFRSMLRLYRLLIENNITQQICQNITLQRNEFKARFPSIN